jgi:DNA-binding transcriptional LysR family regulator
MEVVTLSVDIDLLKTFLEINRTRHFGKASENLFVTQSTVSARIRQLEEIVGAPVFTRTRNDIQLTAAGQRLLHHAENILTIWNQARQQIAVDSDQQVPFSVAGVPSMWDIVLQDWLNKACKKRHRLSISAEVINHDTIVRRLRDGTLDLGFTFDPLNISEIESKEILRIPLIMVSSKDKLTVEQATQTDYVLVDWGTTFSTMHARTFPDLPSPHLRTSQGRIALGNLLVNGGTAYLAEPMVKHQLAKGKLYRVKGAPEIERPAFANYPQASEKTGLIDELISILPDKLLKPRGSRQNR